MDTVIYDDLKTEKVQPYWLGNIMMNETVMMIKNESGECCANLLYRPIRIISVRDYTLNMVYKENVDFVVQGKKLIRKSTRIPFMTQEQINGYNLPEQYRKVDQILNIDTDYQILPGGIVYTESPLFYSNYLEVTYVYDVKDLPKNIFKEYDENMSATTEKLQNNSSFSLVTLGDSITEGCSSSAFFHHASYLPPYTELLRQGLEAHYEGLRVRLTNLGKGGEISAYGIQKINEIISANPDLLVIAFGTNDGYGNVSCDTFQSNISAILDAVKKECPQCEFILINAFPANSKWGKEKLYEEYGTALTAMQEKGVTVVDMRKVGQYFLQDKLYPEISANNVNHPNDFMMQIYAQNVLSSIIRWV